MDLEVDVLTLVDSVPNSKDKIMCTKAERAINEPPPVLVYSVLVFKGTQTT
jgi:hypothetical protein